MHDFTAVNGEICYDFDLRLSGQGSDFKMYANTGYVENTRDTDLLVCIASALMTVRSGVQEMNVKGFALVVKKSSAVDSEEITQLILDAAHRAGYMVEFTNKHADERARRGY